MERAVNENHEVLRQVEYKQGQLPLLIAIKNVSKSKYFKIVTCGDFS